MQEENRKAVMVGLFSGRVRDVAMKLAMRRVVVQFPDGHSNLNSGRRGGGRGSGCHDAGQGVQSVPR